MTLFKRLFMPLLLASGLSVATLITSAPSASADDCLACDVIERLIAKAPYKGAVRPASIPMACARILARQAVPVVWVNGNKDNYVSAPVITGTSIVYTETFPLGNGWVVTESCIKRSLLNGVPKLVLCTGQEKGRGFHWALTNRELTAMKSDGHFTSYVPFMTVADRKSFDPGQVTEIYKKRYSR